MEFSGKCRRNILFCFWFGLFDNNLEKKSPRLLTPPPIHQHLTPTNLSLCVCRGSRLLIANLLKSASQSWPQSASSNRAFFRPDSKMDKSKAKSKMKMKSRGSYSPRTRNRVHAFDSSQKKPPAMMADSRAISRRCWRKRSR